MKFFQYSTLFCLALLVLTSCGSKESTPTAQTQTSVAPSALPVPSTPAAMSAAGIPALQRVTSNTILAVQAGDFPKAKAEFSKFEDSWKTVEDGVKKKSPSTYEAIEANMDKVQEALKSSDKPKSFAALQALGQQLTAATKA